MGKALAAARRAAIIAAGFSLGSAELAFAQSAPDILTRAGLIGRWSRDCETAAMGGNPYTIFERVQGGTGAQFRIDAGTTGTIRRIVENVRMLSANTITMRIKTFPDSEEPMNAEVVIQLEPNRIRAISSVGTDGKFHIREGKMVSTGNESPWTNRCPE